MGSPSLLGPNDNALCKLWPLLVEKGGWTSRPCLLSVEFYLCCHCGGPRVEFIEGTGLVYPFSLIGRSALCLSLEAWMTVKSPLAHAPGAQPAPLKPSYIQNQSHIFQVMPLFVPPYLTQSLSELPACLSLSLLSCCSHFSDESHRVLSQHLWHFTCPSARILTYSFIYKSSRKREML